MLYVYSEYMCIWDIYSMLIICWSYALQKYSPSVWLEFKTSMFSIIMKQISLEITTQCKKEKVASS